MGHLSKMLPYIRKNLDKLILDCIKHDKKIYAFDDTLLQLYGKEIAHLFSFPKFEKTDLPHGMIGKMWDISIPVVAFLGTGPQQGKFTSQVLLVNKLKEKGYKAGFISAEPTGHLFDADVVFPYGYESTVTISNEECVVAINHLAYQLFLQKNDVIVYGLQSGMVPRNFDNMHQLTSIQASLLFGLPPDIIILCVNPDDELEYINRTIEFVRSYSQGKVLHLLIYPCVHEFSSSGILQPKECSLDELETFEKQLTKNFNLGVSLMSEKSVEELVTKIIRELGGEE